MMKLLAGLVCLLWSLPSSNSIKISGAGDLFLVDKETGIEGVLTIFLNEGTGVEVKDITFADVDETAGNSTLTFATYVDGDEAPLSTGTIEIDPTNLPSGIDAGEIILEKRGKRTLRVDLTLNATVTSSGTYRAYPAGSSIIPLLVVLVLAVTTRMVGGC